MKKLYEGFKVYIIVDTCATFNTFATITNGLDGIQKITKNYLDWRYIITSNNQELKRVCNILLSNVKINMGNIISFPIYKHSGVKLLSRNNSPDKYYDYGAGEYIPFN